MRKPVIGQRVRTRSGRLCKVIGIIFYCPEDALVLIVDLNTGEEFDMLSEFLSEEDRPNWLYEGF